MFHRTFFFCMKQLSRGPSKQHAPLIIVLFVVPAKPQTAANFYSGAQLTRAFARVRMTCPHHCNRIPRHESVVPCDYYMAIIRRQPHTGVHMHTHRPCQSSSHYGTRNHNAKTSPIAS